MIQTITNYAAMLSVLVVAIFLLWAGAIGAAMLFIEARDRMKRPELIRARDRLLGECHELDRWCACEPKVSETAMRLHDFIRYELTAVAGGETLLKDRKRMCEQIGDFRSRIGADPHKRA